MNSPNCLSDSEFRRTMVSFLKARRVAYPLSPESFADLICKNGTYSRETTLYLVDLFGISMVEQQSTNQHTDIWYARICKGEAQILYPKDRLNIIGDDFESDNLELEHEFGHLCYWGMMNYFGKLRKKERNYFEENYAWKFAYRLRIGDVR